MLNINFKWDMDTLKYDIGNLELPDIKTQGAAAKDIMSAENHTIYCNQIIKVSTGFYMEVPEGYYAQISIRSGIAFKHGVTLINGIGIIDCDYRGIVGLALINFGEIPFEIKKGDRIAQMMVKETTSFNSVLVKELSKTKRERGGFGSTGIK